MKKFIPVTLVATSLLLGGCAAPQVQNGILGAGLGAVAGAIIGDNSRAVRRGAILGGVLGMAAPVGSYGSQPYPYGQPQQVPYPQQYPQFYGQQPPPGLSCQSGMLVFINGQWLCQHGGVPQPQPYGYQPQYAPAPYGTYHADPRTCPRVMVPGGWRCQ